MMLMEKEIRHFHMACGLGGGAKGFNRASARVGNLVGKFRCIGGVDVDPAACRDFERMAGVPATLLDLMDAKQYEAFHGKKPPADYREAIPADIHRACGGERPHIVFASYPCKGFSGLLSEKASAGAKYQALNGLTLRGMWLVLEAFKDDPVELIVFENVPRIATRGRWLLDQICGLLRSYGYAVAETTHDCGELGGLAQSRKRFLLVARYAPKVPNFLYEPTKKKLRGVGEVLDKLPLPLSGQGGPMHRMPALQWKTWVRLAFVEAGSDWRSLDKLKVEDGVLRDFGIMPDRYLNHGVLGVRRWDQPAPTVTGRSAPLTGAHAVADPRCATEYNADVLGVRQWHEPSGTVPGRSYPNNGAYSVADPRFQGQPRRATFGVRGWHDPSGVIGGESWPTNGAYAVSDPRVDGHPKSVQLGVRPWDQPAGVITGKMYAGGGPNSVADPRIAGKPRFNNVYRIVPYDAPAPAVAGPGGPAGGLAVADPRAGDGRHVNGKYRITAFDEPANVVIGASTTGNGAFAVADPRTGWTGAHENKLAVREWDGPAKTVTGSDRVGSGAQSVADPRCTGYAPTAHRNKLKVVDWYLPAFTVTGGKHGVVPYCAATRAIIGTGQHDNGPWSVADPRMSIFSTSNEAGKIDMALPGPSERLVCVIQALDLTWHRPFTTLELAAIQSLVDPEEYLELDGLSDSAWRERIGNAVPPEAAEAMGGVLGRCLLGAWSGETFQLSSEKIWVRDVAVALMAAQ